jgi:hypothetical protein
LALTVRSCSLTYLVKRTVAHALQAKLAFRLGGSGAVILPRVAGEEVEYVFLKSFLSVG